MEVIAYIPALPCTSTAGNATTVEIDPPAAAATPGPLPEPVAAGPTATGDAGPQAVVSGEESIYPRRRAGNRPARAVFSPSVIVLAAVAAAVWAAAWRNDRLRAIEQQRPQRVAMEPPPSAGAERSVTP